GPNSGYDSTPEYKCFTHLDAFLRWVERGERVDQLVLWTSKPEEQRIAAHLRPYVGSVCFAELDLTHQQRFIHLDPLGTAHQSSLTKVKVKPVPGYELAKVDPDGPVAVCLQVESDWQFQNNQMFADNFSMLAFLLATWPEERFIVRPHPLQ